MSTRYILINELRNVNNQTSSCDFIHTFHEYLETIYESLFISKQFGFEHVRNPLPFENHNIYILVSLEGEKFNYLSSFQNSRKIFFDLREFKLVNSHFTIDPTSKIIIDKIKNFLNLNPAQNTNKFIPHCGQQNSPKITKIGKPNTVNFNQKSEVNERKNEKEPSPNKKKLMRLVIKNKKKKLDLRKKELSDKIQKLESLKREKRIKKEKEESEFRIYKSDISVYFKIKDDIDKYIEIYDDDNFIIPSLFADKYPVFKIMNDNGDLNKSCEESYLIFKNMFEEYIEDAYSDSDIYPKLDDDEDIFMKRKMEQLKTIKLNQLKNDATQPKNGGDNDDDHNDDLNNDDDNEDNDDLGNDNRDRDDFNKDATPSINSEYSSCGSNNYNDEYNDEDDNNDDNEDENDDEDEDEDEDDDEDDDDNDYNYDKSETYLESSIGEGIDKNFKLKEEMVNDLFN